jgi:2-keto-4-pentenoate hydratase/2-oxohepta-3-ene-1,7-dioic acid hydratase in catechol pathway
MAIPKFPILFVSPPTPSHSQPRSHLQYKPMTSVSGPTDPIPIHPMAQQGNGLDYECELVAIIGTACSSVSESTALSHVLGYAIGNDVSHRDWQIKHGGGQWSLGKGFDGWAPYGPGIVSADLIKDPQNLRIQTKVNGEVRQDSNTKDMIFGVAKTIAFLSQGTTLLPGDVIFTGTPQGVGMGRKPQLWLKDGDVVEVGLEGVGWCTNKVEFGARAEAKL